MKSDSLGSQELWKSHHQDWWKVAGCSWIWRCVTWCNVEGEALFLHRKYEGKKISTRNSLQFPFLTFCWDSHCENDRINKIRFLWKLIKDMTQLGKKKLHWNQQNLLWNKEESKKKMWQKEQNVKKINTMFYTKLHNSETSLSESIFLYPSKSSKTTRLNHIK